jgi:hypothetical protein
MHLPQMVQIATSESVRSARLRPCAWHSAIYSVLRGLYRIICTVQYDPGLLRQESAYI